MDIDEIQEEMNLSELLQNLLDDGYIEHDTAIGITKKVIKDGIESLRGDQRTVYGRYVEPIFNNSETKCGRCQETIDSLPTNEKYFLISNGYCSLCESRMTKDD